MSADARRQQPKPPVRVMFLDHTAKLGGGEIALYHLLLYLDKSRFKPIAVLAMEGPLADKLRAAGIDTTIIPLSSEVTETRKDSLGAGSILKLRAIFILLGYTWRMSRVIKEQRVQLVHTNSLKADIIGGIAARLAGVPVVWHIRDRIEDDYLPKPVTWLFRRLCRIIPDFVVANSAATLSTLRLPGHERNTVVHSGYADANAILKAGNGAAVVHDGVTPHVLEGRQKPEIPVIGLVGRITRWKGQHIFLAAIAEVRRRFPQIECQIIGSAMFGEEAYEAELRDLVIRLGLEDCVRFLGFRSDIQSCIHDLDILVHASITGEPFGQVIVEAMVGARPVIATNGGGVPEIVQDGVTGYLVPMGDVAAMALAISKLLADPVMARKMGMMGRDRALKHFTVELTAQRLGKVFEAVLREASPSSEVPASGMDPVPAP